MTRRESQLPRGALYVALGQATFVLGGFALHIVLSRWLTPTLFGLFNVTMTILVWSEIVVNNGVPVALQRFLPDENLAEATVLRAAARCQAIIGLGLFAAMFLAAPLLAALLRDPAMSGILRLAFVDILAMSAYAYYRGVLNGWRVFRQLALTIGAYSLTKVAAIVLLVLLGFGVSGALVGNIASSLGGLAMGFFWARRRKPGGQWVSVEGGRSVGEGEIMRFVLPAALFTLTSNILLGLDLMGVKAFVADGDQVGYYSAAVKLAEAPRLVLLAFSFTLLPSLSRSIAAREPEQTRRYLQQMIRMLALVLLPIVALVTTTAGGAIGLIFPPDYVSAAPVLALLIASYALYTVYITLVTALLAEGRPVRALLIPLTLLPLEAVAVWLGVTRWGPVGAALASLSSVGTAAAVVVVYVFRRFRPAEGPLLRSLLRIGAASLVVGGLARLWNPVGWILVAAYGLLGLLYLGLLLALGERIAI